MRDTILLVLLACLGVVGLWMLERVVSLLWSARQDRPRTPARPRRVPADAVLRPGWDKEAL